MFPVLMLAVFLIAAPATAQDIPARRLTARQVPVGVAFRGEVKAARQWRDRLGENLLLLTNTGEVATPDASAFGDSIVSVDIHAYHYVRNGAGFRLLWHSVDYLRDCDAALDAYLDFAPGSLRITDVDADGNAETSFVYRDMCSGGADGMGMKLIMHEGATKYAIRGTTNRTWDPPPAVMRIDPSFARVPALRAFAVRQWHRFARDIEPEGPP
jgi:hypothetical protein